MILIEWKREGALSETKMHGSFIPFDQGNHRTFLLIAMINPKIMFSTGVLLLRCLLICVGLTVPLAAETTFKSQEEFALILKKQVDKVNAWYQQQEFGLSLPNDTTFKYDTDLESKEKIGVFGSRTIAKITVPTGQIIEFYNYMLADRAGFKLFPQKVQPSWKKEKAVEIARQFASLFVDPAFNDLELGFARYEESRPDGMDQTKWNMGQWRVLWRRKTHSGIPFHADNVQVCVYEGYGPYLIFIKFMSRYEDKPFEKLPMETIMTKGKEGLQKILDWPPARQWFGPNVKIVGEPKAFLEIVNPNYLTESKSIKDSVFTEQRDGRPAWVIYYRVSSRTPAADGSGVVPVDQKIVVYIDAETGKFLGGDM